MDMTENEENQRVKRIKYGGRKKGTPNKVRLSEVAERFAAAEREKRIEKARYRARRAIKSLLDAAGASLDDSPLEAIVLLPMPDETRLQVRTVLLNLDAEIKRLSDLVNNPIRRRNRQKKQPAV